MSVNGDDENLFGMSDKEYKKILDLMRRRTATARITEASQKRMLDYENKLIKQRRMEQILTRSVSGMGGGVVAPIFSMLQNIGQAKYAGYQKLQEIKGLESQRILTKEEVRERDLLSGSTKSNRLFGKLDKTFEKHFGGDSKWNKFFGGQGKMAAAGIGMGAIGGGMALGKMIIDSSPMFQQMLKLLNFGIMMVLRPIGDFFGFLMRPIMLMLLRKFIIPFYQTALPVLQEMGTILGEQIAGGIENLLVLLDGVGNVIYGALTFNSELQKQGFDKINGVFDTSIDVNETNPEVRNAGEKISSTFTAVGESISSKFEKTSAALEALKDAPQTKAAEAASLDLSKQIAKWTGFMSSKGLLNQEGLLKTGRVTTEAHAGIRQGKFTSADEAMYWFSEQMFKGGVNKYANGGIINEPVFGLGRSGKGYLLGESGAERVTPISGGGSQPITINVYGDVNDRTMDSFERKVLEVLNKSNSRRGL